MAVRSPQATVLVIALTLLLVALSPIAVAGGEGGDGEAGSQGSESSRGQDRADEARNRSSSSSGPGGGPADDNGDDRGPPSSVPAPAGVGRISVQEGSYVGTFIALDATTNGIANYSYEGVTVFDAITADNLTVEDSRARGASLRLQGTADGSAVELRFHDTPSAVAKLKADGGTPLTLTLASGISGTQVNARTIQLSGPGFQGVLWSDDDPLSQTGGVISTTGGDSEVKFMAARGPMMADDAAAALGQGVADAASEGRVGAEVRAFQVDGAFQSEVVALTDMTVLVNRRGNGVLLMVSSDNATGRTVVIHLDSSLLNNSSMDEIEVRFDGEPTSAADGGLADVLDPGDDDGRAEHVLVLSGGGLQALVSVPGFSVHSIEVAAIGQVLAEIGITPAQALAALGAAAATVALAAVAAGKRRR